MQSAWLEAQRAVRGQSFRIYSDIFRYKRLLYSPAVRKKTKSSAFTKDISRAIDQDAREC